MQTLSATDVAIAAALANGTLAIAERPSRFAGETYIALSDEHGLIEVHLSREEADERIGAILDRVGSSDMTTVERAAEALARARDAEQNARDRVDRLRGGHQFVGARKTWMRLGRLRLHAEWAYCNARRDVGCECV